MELLKKLTETPGVSGREEKIRDLIRNEMKPLVDSVEVDTLGNVVGLKKGGGSAPGKAMVIAHMDEIGFLVTYIDDDGFIRITPVGGFDPRTLVAQRVTVHGEKDLPGTLMPAVKPIHLMKEEEKKKGFDVPDFFIDVGLPGEEVKKLVSVGDPVTLSRSLLQVGQTISGKAFDDRLGVYVMLEALRRMGDHQFDICAVASVEEERGLIGAITAGYRIEPDVCIALDLTIALDTPGSDKKDRVTSLGEGTAIKIMDSGSISNPALVRFLKELAEKEGIKHQMEILPRGATDAAAVKRSRGGVPVGTISIPGRYVHSNVETVHKADVEASIDLLSRFLERAHEADYRLA